MGFFDDLGAAISQTGNQMASKTRDMMDIASMNSQIDKDKSRVRQIFMDIGERYYNLHKNDQDEIFGAEIGMLNGIFAEMEDLGNRINGLKAPKPQAPGYNEAPAFCTQCGAKVEPGSAFCTSCGHKHL